MQVSPAATKPRSYKSEPGSDNILQAIFYRNCGEWQIERGLIEYPAVD